MLKTITIEGMSCSHCENRVKNALAKLDVKVIEISAANDMAKVEFESDDKLSDIVNAIEDAGYDVIEVL